MKNLFLSPFLTLPRKVRTFLVFLCLIHSQAILAQTFPVNFAGVQVATGLDPVGMDVAPDGRVFLAEKNGKVRIIKNGSLLAAPFIAIANVDNWNERGLMKVLLDPNFSTNRYLYVFYTCRPAGSLVSFNRVSRLTANGDVAVAGSELVLIDMDPLGSVGWHNGGGLAIRDGKLFISTGENTVTSNSQSLTTLKGKVLRINTNGSIPADNPFYYSATGKNKAIWALGFRNPFRLTVQPGTGKLFINDVGGGSWRKSMKEWQAKIMAGPQLRG
jgi:glucose/arabinose dehydrogenase